MYSVKKTIFTNIFAKYLLAFSFVLTFSFSFGTTTFAQEDPSRLVPCGGYNADDTLQPDCDFSYLVLAAERIIDFLIFTIAMPIAAICFMYAGYMYLTAGANIGSTAKAKKIFWNVLWGLVIALSAWLIVNTIMVGLGVDDGTDGEADLIYLEP